MKRRGIKSFVRRQGRMTAAQQQALVELGPDYFFNPSAFSQDLFAKLQPLVIEIGFGMGDSLAEMVSAHPEWNFIGIEVHKPGIGALLQKLDQPHQQHLRILNHDAVDFFQCHLPDATIDRLMIFFPDPWPKKRHHKRRILNANFLDVIARKLKPGGLLHVATDWQPYAEEVLQLLNHHEAFANLSMTQDYVVNDGLRPATKFEKRAEREGRASFDLLFACHSNAFNS